MMSIPCFGSEGTNAPNKSTIGKPPNGVAACAEEADGDDIFSNAPINELFSLLDDKPSCVDRLL